MSGGRLAGRIALVTGASRGLGAAIAERFAGEGASLVLVARTESGLEATDDRVRAAGGKATLVPLDLREGEAVDRLGGAVFERFGRLDILVAAAGDFGLLTPVSHLDPRALADVVTLNLGANHRLIRSLDPLLRASKDGRAVFVTAPQARNHRQFWGAYAASKAALEALVLTYAAEVAKFGVKVNLVEPDPLRTRLRARAYPGEDPARIPPPESATSVFVDLADPTSDVHGEIVPASPPARD
jgi:NAD(P)-dependent dehydrogenase (short-subunit alcohol dehydrogenase family)